MTPYQTIENQFQGTQPEPLDNHGETSGNRQQTPENEDATTAEKQCPVSEAQGDATEGQATSADGQGAAEEEPNLAEQEKQERTLLVRVLIALGASRSAADVPDDYWDSVGDILSGSNAARIAHALYHYEGEGVETALKGVRILGEHLAEGMPSKGYVPVLCLEVHTQLTKLNVSSSSSSFLYGVSYLLLGNSMDEVASGIGCSTETIVAGVKAIRGQGLKTDLIHPNAAGAGRLDIETIFSENMKPVVIAAGHTEEELELRRESIELDRLANTLISEGAERGGQSAFADASQNPDAQESQAEADTQDTTGGEGNKKPDNGETKGKDELRQAELILVDPQELYQEMNGNYQEAVRFLDIIQARTGENQYLLESLLVFQKAKGDIDEIYLPFLQGEAGSDAIVRFDVKCTFFILTNELNVSCKKLIGVRDENRNLFDGPWEDPGKAAIELKNKAVVLVRSKTFLRDIKATREIYERYKDLLESYERHKEEYGGTNAGTAERDYGENYRELCLQVLGKVEFLRGKLQNVQGFYNSTSRTYKNGEKTLAFLATLGEDFLRTVPADMSQEPDASMAQLVIASTLDQWLGEAIQRWEEHRRPKKAYKAVIALFGWIRLQDSIHRTFKIYGKVVDDARKAEGEENGEGSTSPVPTSTQEEGTTPDTNSDTNSDTDTDTGADTDTDTDADTDSSLDPDSVNDLEANRRKVSEAFANTEEVSQILIGFLQQSLDSKQTRKNSTGDQIAEAISKLHSSLEGLAHLKEMAEGCTSGLVLDGLANLLAGVYRKHKCWVDSLVDDPRYTNGKKVAGFICTKKHKNTLDTISEKYEGLVEEENYKWDSSIPNHYKKMSTDNDYLGLYSDPDTYLSPSERKKIVGLLWDEGKDPTSVAAWLDYIMANATRYVYGTPDKDYCCCRITADQLSNSFRYLTGVYFSGKALWNYLKREMGYTRHQCEKVEQLGAAHPQRHEQYDYIMSNRKNIDMNKTLVLSIDSKSFIKLGRYKHDSGLLLCAPDGKVYRTHDHDFVQTMRDRYPNGTDLVDESRMDERAVLYPLGCYVENNNTGTVVLILGKDSAEAMANMLISVIQKCRESMPDIEEVLITADGGGSNTANGILWQAQLLRVSKAASMKLTVMHYPPGKSRFNRIERALWAPISRSLRGKALDTIEDVSRHVCRTTTKGGNGQPPLHVECYFDSKKYKRRNEALETQTLTRKKLEEKAQGRIVHPFDKEKDGALYKWNYIILPEVPETEAV